MFQEEPRPSPDQPNNGRRFPGLEAHLRNGLGPFERQVHNLTAILDRAQSFKRGPENPQLRIPLRDRDILTWNKGCEKNGQPLSQ